MKFRKTQIWRQDYFYCQRDHRLHWLLRLQRRERMARMTAESMANPAQTDNPGLTAQVGKQLIFISSSRKSLQTTPRLAPALSFGYQREERMVNGGVTARQGAKVAAAAEGPLHNVKWFHW
ncbi:hypothetical protein VVD49_18515 [Uliginosibacterium sp. H3]|uniref:Uncharacterized protein n=1 Tax=Uliginosibacterium silvisoli TaxID=3114758 RepID=A0ABU6K9M1_9RHOO|nr:hypothetical protein [Uliginosibacterium sp. H3]